MYFQDLQGKLIGIARERIQAGELTERGLARMCGISQPHIHNVLKNVRLLSTEALDRLMRALDIRVADLLWGVSKEPGPHFRAIPLVRNRIGPGSEAALTSLRGHYPFPEPLLSELVEPLAARLGPDLVLPRGLVAHDLVLLDQNPLERSAPSGDTGVWVVKEGSSLSVRYVRRGGTHLYVGNEATHEQPERWRAVPLAQRNILDIVKARIVWISRKMEKGPAGPPDAAGHGDRGVR